MCLGLFRPPDRSESFFLCISVTYFYKKSVPEFKCMVIYIGSAVITAIKSKKLPNTDIFYIIARLTVLIPWNFSKQMWEVDDYARAAKGRRNRLI